MLEGTAHILWGTHVYFLGTVLIFGYVPLCIFQHHRVFSDHHFLSTFISVLCIVQSRFWAPLLCNLFAFCDSGTF